MDTPPTPKPRTTIVSNDEPAWRPIPLPRTKLPAANISNERVSASDIFRSISTVSKQISEDVAAKVQYSAKSANEKIEKSFIDGTKMAKDTLGKTISTSRAVRDSVTRSVIEGTKTASSKLRRSKKPSTNTLENNSQRCVSMPVNDISLFDNIQFHSPLLEQKKYKADADDSQDVHKLPLSQNLSTNTYDDLSIFSNNSDSNMDTASTVSYDSRENVSLSSNINKNAYDIPNCDTYDTPRALSRSSSISYTSTESSLPEIPERRKRKDNAKLQLHRNLSYENWLFPNEFQSEKRENIIARPSKSTIYEFDPLNTSTSSYVGVSNELLLLQSFLIGDMYGTIVTNDSNEDSIDDLVETDYFNPPTPPERSDSLFGENNEELSKNANKNSKWFVDETTDAKPVEAESKMNTVKKKFSNMLKLDNVLNKSGTPAAEKLESVQKPPVSTVSAFHNGILTRIVSGVDDFFKNSQARYCMLSDHKLLCYADHKHSSLKEELLFDNIYSIQMILPLSSR